MAARALIWTAVLTYLSLALFYGSAIVFSGAPLSDIIVVDWINRILITTYVLWLLVEAFHVGNRRPISVLRSTVALSARHTNCTG
jgi:hypothetical protein